MKKLIFYLARNFVNIYNNRCVHINHWKADIFRVAVDVSIAFKRSNYHLKYIAK